MERQYITFEIQVIAKYIIFINIEIITNMKTNSFLLQHIV